MMLRIRFLMIDIAVASVSFTFWHLIPNTRFAASMTVLLLFMMLLPTRLQPPKPGLGFKGLARWPDAYDISVLVGFEVINVLCSGLSNVMATWPG
jgi:hypothetical protein